jgi:hypothetical protein
MASESKDSKQRNNGGSVRMHLTILPQRLWIASLKKSFLPSCSYALMKLLLFEDENRGFFSFTDTDDEISLVLGETSLKIFSNIPNIKESWEVCDHPWLAIQVCEGSLGFTSMGVVHAVSDPLAKAGISIFNISTTETDFTLVPEDRIYDAIDCLEDECSILTEGLAELANILPRPEKKIDKGEEKVFKQHPLSLPHYELYLSSSRNRKRLLLPHHCSRYYSFPKPNRVFSRTPRVKMRFLC